MATATENLQDMLKILDNANVELSNRYTGPDAFLTYFDDLQNAMQNAGLSPQDILNTKNILEQVLASKNSPAQILAYTD